MLQEKKTNGVRDQYMERIDFHVILRVKRHYLVPKPASGYQVVVVVVDRDG